MPDIYDTILEEEMKKTQERPIFSKYSENAFIDAPGELLTSLFVNHESDVRTMLKSYLSVCNNLDVGERLAIIAPSRMGKTALVMYFMQKTAHHSHDKQMKTQFMYFIPAKLASKELLEEKLTFPQHIEGKGIIVLDDFHEIYYETDAAIKNKALDILFNKFKKSLIITTWTPMGWQQAVAENPNTQKIFDKIIYLEGLSSAHMEDMVYKRISAMCESSRNPINEDAIKYAVQKSSGNPGLLLMTILEGIKHAQKNNSVATKTDVESVLPTLGFGLEEKYYKLSDTYKYMISNALLAKTTSDNETLQFITKLQRNTISEYMTELEKMGFVEKKKVKKKVLFRLKPALRFWLEKKKLEEAQIQKEMR